VREKLGQARASEFAKAASSAGFTSRETRLVAGGLRDADITVADLSAPAWRQTFKTPHGSLTVSTIEQAGLIRRAMGYVPYETFFGEFAVIRIAVRPRGLRDYNVVINGEACPTTPKATYLVPPGKATVAVTRPGKPPCAWAGSVAGGKKQTVRCRL
jgi:hypothetical protein